MSDSFKPFTPEHLHTVAIGFACVAAILLLARRGGAVGSRTTLALVAPPLTGGNFAYASHPPENPSLLDHLGPWPWYILSMLGLAVLSFSLLCLPFAKSKPTTS